MYTHKQTNTRKRIGEETSISKKKEKKILDISLRKRRKENAMCDMII